MKKIFLAYSLLIISLLVFVPSVNAQESFTGRTLTIYNVADYISTNDSDYVDLIEKFEEEYNVTVNYYTYDTNETMYNQFKLQKEGTYDLVCTSDYMIQKMIKEDLVIPYDDLATAVPNYAKYASGTLRNKLKNMTVLKGDEIVNLDEYAVGYMWGTLGIVYNPDVIDRADVESWDAFYDEDYKNLISIKNSIRDAFVVGVMHSYSKEADFIELKNNYINNPNEINKQKYNEKIQNIFDLNGSEEENLQKIARVKEKLINLKENIFGFEVDSGKNDIVSGDKIQMNLAYSGDAVFSIGEAEKVGKTLEYSVPLDGSNIWYDAWVLPKGSTNKDLAYEFLNFLSDPKNASDNMDYIGYTPYIVGDDIFTLTGSWYGATDFCITSNYYEYVEEDDFGGEMVIFNNELFTCIKDKPSDLLVDPTNEEYFESCEYSENETYFYGDMVSYNGTIYNCITENEDGTSAFILDINAWEEVEPYNLEFLFSGTLTEGRRALVYPYLGCLNSLQTQYPSEEIIARCAIMNDFGTYNENVVIMWGQVKAYTNMLPVYIFLTLFALIVIVSFTFVIVRRRMIYNFKKNLK